ncbi:MAG: NAD(P)H-binding protein [Novosphingobium sp.]|nr:NAD(P)H-binding protein [Novosphingobium sp.]
MTRVALLGATGTIGRATAQALVEAGHEVVAMVRRQPAAPLPGVTLRIADPADPASLMHEGFAGEHFDAVVSCMASRTGLPRDAWAIDHKAHSHALALAERSGAQHFVLLSAICVQRPRLAFQQAKLAFEAELIASGLRYSIVRPTAFFKSLSGQIARVRQGKPFLLFGDGTRTACKPISDRDSAAYIAACLTAPARWNKVLPIGGPGPAITPRQQGEALFALTGLPPRYRSVPPGFLGGVAGALGLAARLVPPLATKAELARIGHYYATESMLVLDPATGRYSAALTPETGRDTLFEHYRAILSGEAAPDERGDHAVF